jgi:predicted MarR family transcription regulator
MDFRVQAYRPVTVQSFNSGGGRAVAVSDARQSGPVPSVAAINPYNQNLSRLATELRQATGGYTDSVRGGKINILA